jgi:hypothetical protein
MTGRFSAALIQGGQRWQSIQLISEGTVSFDQVGFEATVDATEVEEYPGQFDCDDEELNATGNWARLLPLLLVLRMARKVPSGR